LLQVCYSYTIASDTGYIKYIEGDQTTTPEPKAMNTAISLKHLATLTEDEIIANTDPSDTIYTIEETGHKLDIVQLFDLWNALYN